MTPQDARFILECFRAGVSSTRVSELFSLGQSRLVGAFQEFLEKPAGALAIEGGYGQGKTHLLKHLAQLAKRRNYVVSLVTLSKETPFHHWWHLYGEAISQAERPDALHDPGLRGLLRRHRWDDPVIQGLSAFGAHVHPRLATALRCYYEAGDGETQHRVLGDLMGHALSNGELGRIYRAATQERVKLPAARLIQTGRDYFAFAGKLFQLAGYAGWVVLFDEFELVAKLSALQRARAYANLEAFRQAADIPGFAGIRSVVAFIPAMVSDSLLPDLVNVPNALRTRGREAEGDSAEASLRWLVEQKLGLAPLTETTVLEVLDQIAALHERAYGWNRPAGRFYVPAASAAERMRTRVRYCVEALDLTYVYGEVPAIQTHEMPLPRLQEDEALFEGRVGDVVVEEVDR